MKGMTRFELDVLYARAKAKLWGKVDRLRVLRDEGPLRLADFGTRRRHGFLWQRWCVEALQEGLGKSFIGTSNVKHAMDTGVEAIGTNAHELPMVYAALAPDDAALRQAPYAMLADWAKLYDGNLLIMLPDTFGTTAFLSGAPDWVADWRGGRPDSRPPMEGAQELMDWWKIAGARSAPEADRAQRRDDDRVDRGDGALPARQGGGLDRLGHEPHQRFQGVRAEWRRRRSRPPFARVQGHRGRGQAGGEALRQSGEDRRPRSRGRALQARVRLQDERSAAGVTTHQSSPRGRGARNAPG
jgi:hypothetical protein